VICACRKNPLADLFPVNCSMCRGQGWIPGEETERFTAPCHRCGGRGSERCPSCAGLGTCPCLSCGGRGNVECPSCRRGRRVVNRHVVVSHLDVNLVSEAFADRRVPETVDAKLQVSGSSSLVHEQQVERFAPTVSITASCVALVDAIRKCLAEADAAVTGSERVVQQRLQVFRVDLFHGRYVYNRRRYDAWLVGSSLEVVSEITPRDDPEADLAPRSWGSRLREVWAGSPPPPLKHNNPPLQPLNATSRPDGETFTFTPTPTARNPDPELVSGPCPPPDEEGLKRMIAEKKVKGIGDWLLTAIHPDCLDMYLAAIKPMMYNFGLKIKKESYDAATQTLRLNVVTLQGKPLG
jgi:hypothetical protein